MTSNAKPDAPQHAIASYVILGAVLLALIESYELLAPILLSLFLTLLISIALNPLVSRLQAFTGGRRLAAGLVAMAVILLLALVAVAGLGPMRDSAVKLSQQLPDYWARLQKPLIKMQKQAVLSEQKLQTEVTNEMAQTAKAEGKPDPARQIAASAPPKTAKEPESIRSTLGRMAEGVLSSFAAAAFNAAQIAVVLVTVFFGVTFTLMDPHPVFGTLFALLPAHCHAKTLIIIQRIGKFVPGWARATLIAMISVGLLVFLLMWPIFGFIDALALGVIAGVLEAVPYLGPVLSAIPALLLALGNGGLTPLWVVLAYLVVQELENNVILPVVMAHSIKLHPVAVIFSMLICVIAFGVLGVLVASPLVGILGILYEELYRKRLLPGVTDADLDRLARGALREKPAAD